MERRSFLHSTSFLAHTMKKYLLPAFLCGTMLFAGCFRTQETSHPQFGKEVWVGVAALSGTKNPSVNGAAIGHLFADGTFVQTVQLNVEKLGAKHDYGVWLYGKNSDDRVFVGFLQNPTADVRHSLTFTKKLDLSAYTAVSVTLQDTGKSAIPGPEVAHGEVKASKK